MGTNTNVKEYTKFVLNERSIQCLLRSEADIENGRTKSLEEVKQLFKEKYGIE